jgi:hypothetical protein
VNRKVLVDGPQSLDFPGWDQEVCDAADDRELVRACRHADPNVLWIDDADLFGATTLNSIRDVGIAVVLDVRGVVNFAAIRTVAAAVDLMVVDADLDHHELSMLARYTHAILVPAAQPFDAAKIALTASATRNKSKLPPCCRDISRLGPP